MKKNYIYLDPLNHLFNQKQSDNSTDPIYETIDQTPIIDIKPKPTSTTNTFFSKTKDKFVTAVNKLVDNYGNIPKKQTYINHQPQRPSSTTNEQSNPTSTNEQKPSNTKRQAPLAEHIIRQQEQQQQIRQNNTKTPDVTYENTIIKSPSTPAPRRTSISTTNKNSVIF